MLGTGRNKWSIQRPDMSTEHTAQHTMLKREGREEIFSSSISLSSFYRWTSASSQFLFLPCHHPPSLSIKSNPLSLSFNCSIRNILDHPPSSYRASSIPRKLSPCPLGTGLIQRALGSWIRLLRHHLLSHRLRERRQMVKW